MPVISTSWSRCCFLVVSAALSVLLVPALRPARRSSRLDGGVHRLLPRLHGARAPLVPLADRSHRAWRHAVLGVFFSYSARARPRTCLPSGSASLVARRVAFACFGGFAIRRFGLLTCDAGRWLSAEAMTDAGGAMTTLARRCADRRSRMPSAGSCLMPNFSACRFGLLSQAGGGSAHRRRMRRRALSLRRYAEFLSCCLGP